MMAIRVERRRTRRRWSPSPAGIGYRHDVTVAHGGAGDHPPEHVEHRLICGFDSRSGEHAATSDSTSEATATSRMDKRACPTSTPGETKVAGAGTLPGRQASPRDRRHGAAGFPQRLALHQQRMGGGPRQPLPQRLLRGEHPTSQSTGISPTTNAGGVATHQQRHAHERPHRHWKVRALSEGATFGGETATSDHRRQGDPEGRPIIPDQDHRHQQDDPAHPNPREEHSPITEAACRTAIRCAAVAAGATHKQRGHWPSG